MVQDFKAFLMRGNVIDLAVAVIIGAAFSAIVTALAEGIITPLIGMLISKDFTEMTFEVNGSVFSYGRVIDAVIKFLAYSAIVYFVIVRPMQAMAERRRRGEPTEDTPAPSDEAVLLTEIRDLLRSQPRA